MFKWLKKSAARARILGVDVSEHGFGLVVMDRSDAARPLVTDASWRAFNGGGKKARYSSRRSGI